MISESNHFLTAELTWERSETSLLSFGPDPSVIAVFSSDQTSQSGTYGEKIHLSCFTQLSEWGTPFFSCSLCDHSEVKWNKVATTALSVAISSSFPFKPEVRLKQLINWNTLYYAFPLKGFGWDIELFFFQWHNLILEQVTSIILYRMFDLVYWALVSSCCVRKWSISYEEKNKSLSNCCNQNCKHPVTVPFLL